MDEDELRDWNEVVESAMDRGPGESIRIPASLLIAVDAYCVSPRRESEGWKVAVAFSLGLAAGLFVMVGYLALN